MTRLHSENQFDAATCLHYMDNSRSVQMSRIFIALLICQKFEEIQNNNKCLDTTTNTCLKSLHNTETKLLRSNTRE